MPGKDDPGASALAPATATSLAAVGLSVLAALPFWKALAGYGVLFRRDIGMVWYPLMSAFSRCVAEGAWPLWDPNRGFGQPLLADPRAEILYPPSWLSLLLPSGTYCASFLAAHLAFSGLGLALLARRWGLSPLAGFGAAAAWILSGPFVSLAATWHHLAGAAWIPWVFWAAEGVLENQGAASIVALAVAVAAQVLAGSPDYSALTLLALTGYVFARRLGSRPSLRSGNANLAMRLLLAAILSLLISAAQWIPTLEVASRSGRSALSYEDAAEWSLHPAAILESIFQFRWYDIPVRSDLSRVLLEGREPWLASTYLGTSVTILAAAGLLASTRERRGFLAALAVVALLVALGKHALVFPLGRSLLPPLRMLRFPVKAMSLVAFAVALLAGLGIDALRSGTERTAGRLLHARLAALVVALGAVLVWALARTPETWAAEFLSPLEAGWPPYATLFAPIAASLGRAALLAGSVALLVWARRAISTASFTAGILALLSVDLLAAHVDLHPVAPKEVFSHRPEALDLLAAAPGARLYVDDYSILRPQERARRPELQWSYRLARVPAGWTPAAGLVLGVQMYLNPPTAGRWGRPGSYDTDILGFYPPDLSRLAQLLRASEPTPLHLRLLQMGAVTDVVALQPAPWWRDLRPSGTTPGLFQLPIRVFRVPDALPRAYVVAGVRSAAESMAFEALADPSFDPQREAILDEPAQSPADGGSARILGLTSDRILIEAQLPARGYVVLVDAFDPGWRATVDGQEAPVLRANIAFRAVAVPPGGHRIEFRYRPQSVSLGLALSAGGLLTAAGVGLLAMRSRRVPGDTP